MTATDQPSITIPEADKLYIGGEWIDPASDATIDVINPATEDVLFSVVEASSADVDRAVAAARRAFDEGPWPQLSHAERATYLRGFAAAIRERTGELGALWTGEMGVLAAASGQMSGMFATWFDGYADLAESMEFVSRRTPTFGGEVGLLVREPVGVVGAIVPWNGGLQGITTKVGPALLAGCTVVLKMSPQAPGEGYFIARVAEQLGLPPGVLNVVTADREVSEQLVSDPRVDKIAFTGSTAVGRRIASLLSERIGRFTLELGGKSAAVILDDFDPAAAAAALAPMACFGTGQVCSSLTRYIVPRAEHDAFAEAAASIMSGIPVGDPTDPTVGMGPLAMARQRDRVEGYIAKGIEEGATLLTGGGRPAHLDRGWFVEPTVFANVDNAATIAREEIFGPVVAVIPADSEEQAVAMANDSIYGLNAAVFTHDPDRAYRVARRLRSGTVGHNAFRADFGIGFGGFKQSGIGREAVAPEGVEPYLELKTIILDGEPTAL